MAELTQSVKWWAASDSLTFEQRAAGPWRRDAFCLAEEDEDLEDDDFFDDEDEDDDDFDDDDEDFFDDDDDLDDDDLDDDDLVEE